MPATALRNINVDFGINTEQRSLNFVRNLPPGAQAKWKHFEDQVLQGDALRHARNKKILENSEKIAELNTYKMRMQHEIDRSATFPSKNVTDPKTGIASQVPDKDWAALIDLQIAELRTDNKKIEKNFRSQPNYMDHLLPFAAARNAKDYRDVASIEIILKPGQTALDHVKAATAATLAAIQGRNQIELATLPEAEGNANIIADIERRAERGEPSISRCFRGGSLDDRNGNFQLKADRRIEFQTSQTGVYIGDEPRTMPNALDFLCWLNKDAITEKLLVESAKRDHSKAIPLADKPRLLKEADAKILAAQRYEEAAICFAEAQGVRVARREHLMREIVLLAIERIPAVEVVADDIGIADAKPDVVAPTKPKPPKAKGTALTDLDADAIAQADEDEFEG